jgi:hypothetical protein
VLFFITTELSIILKIQSNSFDSILVGEVRDTMEIFVEIGSFLGTLIAIFGFLFYRLQRRVVFRLIDDHKLPNDLSVMSKVKVRYKKFLIIGNGRIYDSMAIVFQVKYRDNEYTLFSTMSGKVSYYP